MKKSKKKEIVKIIDDMVCFHCQSTPVVRRSQTFIHVDSMELNEKNGTYEISPACLGTTEPSYFCQICTDIAFEEQMAEMEQQEAEEAVKLN